MSKYRHYFEDWIDDFGTKVVNVHNENECFGPTCAIHRNTHHHMELDPQRWNPKENYIERVCQHSVGHPDPDDFLNLLRAHDCDGCCLKPEGWDNEFP